MILIILFGLLLSVKSYFDGRKSMHLSSGDTLIRNEFGEGAGEVRLRAAVLGDEYSYRFTIEEREFTKEELEKLYPSFLTRLKEVLLNENDSFSNIRTDIKPVNSIDNYPFRGVWSSRDENILKSNGELCFIQQGDIYETEFSAKISYKDFFKEEVFQLRITGNANNEGLIFEELENRVSRLLEESEKDSSVQLPKTFERNDVSWKEEQNPDFIYIFLGGIVLALIFGRAWENDEKRKREKYAEAMAKIYPVFTEKLKLFMLSGMTVKSAFYAIYDSFLRSGNRKYDILLPKLSTLLNRYRNQMREEEIYELFGKECGGDFKKLMFLLSVNLKKGNDRLLVMLDEESRRAYEGRRSRIKAEAEKAGVKMLFPMMIMLLVVMLLVMLPAYYGFMK